MIWSQFSLVYSRMEWGGCVFGSISCGNKAADAEKATADSIRIADSIAAVEAAAAEAAAQAADTIAADTTVVTETVVAE